MISVLDSFFISQTERKKRKGGKEERRKGGKEERNQVTLTIQQNRHS